MASTKESISEAPAGCSLMTIYPADKSPDPFILSFESERIRLIELFLNAIYYFTTDNPYTILYIRSALLVQQCWHGEVLFNRGSDCNFSGLSPAKSIASIYQTVLAEMRESWIGTKTCSAEQNILARPSNIE